MVIPHGAGVGAGVWGGSGITMGAVPNHIEGDAASLECLLKEVSKDVRCVSRASSRGFDSKRFPFNASPSNFAGVLVPETPCSVVHCIPHEKQGNRRRQIVKIRSSHSPRNAHS